MRVTRLEKWYLVGLLTIFGGIVLHAPISVGLGVLFPEYELLIKSWKEILMIAMSLMGIAIIKQRRLWPFIKSDWILIVLAAYAGLHIILATWLSDSLIVMAAGLAIDLRYILFFTLVYVGVIAVPPLRRYMLIVGTIGAAIIVGFATLQLFLPPDILAHIGYSKDTIMPYLTVDKNPDYVRVNSTLRGPNPLGAYAVMVLGLVTAAIVRGKTDFRKKPVFWTSLVLAVCGTVALWISYSRSALVAGIITVLLVLSLTLMRRLPAKVWVTVASAIFALVGGLVAARDSAFVSNVLLHENPAGGSVISSNEDHFGSLDYGLQQLVREPFGLGVGSTGSASLLGDAPVVVENQYLFIAHETGWVGLLLFVIAYLMILLRLWYTRMDWLSLGLLASGIGLGLIGLLLPVWADDTVAIVWWGLAAIALTRRPHEQKQTK